ncbi:MAG: hypothetical protein ACJAZ9_001047 [Neolewinella sp.]|jgi:hypothetical protein
MRSLFLASLVLFFAAACNRTSGGNAGGGGATAAASKVNKVLKSMDKNSFSAEYMEGRAKIKIESKDFNIGGTATIRIEKDKAIWMSVKKFGLEGARALIRPDSFFVVNRLNGDYTAEPLSYIEEKYKIPARFDLLQEMVMGNAVFFSKNLDLATEGTNYHLSGRDSRFATEHIVDATGYKLLEMNLTELAQNRKLRVTNADFRQAQGLIDQPDFAHKRTIMVDAGEQSGKFEMTFTKLNFSGPFGMPFRKR